MRSLIVLMAFAAPAAAEADPRAVFEKRLMPIFKSPNPSSCVQCHLAGVDLKDYILPDHEKTFRSLRDQGLIDLASPERSKILKLISMGEGDNSAKARVHAKNRQAEYDAFAAWLKACCADPALVKSPPLGEKERAKAARPDEVIRHARKDRLVESFERNVWSMRFRCMGCHTEGTPQADKHVQEHGPRVAWFKKGGPEATMDYLLASRLIDLDAPEKSLLLRKPLGEVKHGGGVKFAPGDQGYKGFRTWVEDIAAIRGDRYARAADLPKDAATLSFGTDLWLKLADAPPAWGDRLLEVRVYAWDAAAKAWEKEPVATSDRVVWGKGKLWQHNLTLLAEPGSERARAWREGKPSLPPGRYLVKVHVDGGGRLKSDWKARLGDGDFAGEAEFTARWREGYGAMTVVDARKVRR
ncbi:MAG: hypothetical protein U0797_06160 [Gemmataceae bacterium]